MRCTHRIGVKQSECQDRARSYAHGGTDWAAWTLCCAVALALCCCLCVFQSWKGRHGHSSGEVVPLPSPALKGGASTSGGAQSHLRRHASVTYRPPMRDVDESAVDSTDNRDTVGPQSSLEGMGSREEQSLTGAAGAGSHWHAHSQTRKLAQQGELSVLVHMYDHFEEEEGDERNAHAAASDPEADITFSDADADADGNVAVGDECAREPSLSACEPMLPHAHAHDHGHAHAHGHALTMHKDGCKCSVNTDAGADVSSDAELVPPTAATVSVFVPVAHARAEEEEESCADREPSTSSASHNVSIHFHSATQSDLSPCTNTASVDGVAGAGECTEVGHEHGPASSTGALARRHVLLTSELDSEFVVARASPELLVATRWEDSAHPYEHGSIVPRAPAFTCACPFPWRSPGHLEKHLQPVDHARNITFEGCQYPGWRGQFYANGEPKALLRGVFHELAFIAVTVYSIFVFRSCASPMAWLAAFVHIGAGWALYGVSSQFHRRLWLLPTYNALKRCDHSAIFLLAAGSSTPAALLMLRDNWSVGSVSLAGLVLLVWSWTVALTGVAHSCFKSLTGRVPLFGLVWMGQYTHYRAHARSWTITSVCLERALVAVTSTLH